MDASVVCATAPAITPHLRSAIQLQNRLCRYMPPCILHLDPGTPGKVMHVDFLNRQPKHYFWFIVVFGLTGLIFCTSCGFILVDALLIGNLPPVGLHWGVLETTSTLIVLALALIEVGIYLFLICYSDCLVLLEKVQILEKQCKYKSQSKLIVCQKVNEGNFIISFQA